MSHSDPKSDAHFEPVTNLVKRGQRTFRLIFLCGALVFGFGLLMITGVIPEWRRWYSGSPYYSVQVNAFLRGDLALSHSPLDSDFDLSWSQGGVQQVWGLGIPLWRLPWTALARVSGFQTFPDHLATGLAFSVVAFLVLVAVVEPALMQRKKLSGAAHVCGGAFILLAFPPFLRVLTTRFLVYEEAVAYAYMYAILEFALLIGFLGNQSTGRWLALTLVAGCGGLVRPPLVFYGFAAWLVGTSTMFSNYSPDSSLRLRIIALLKFKAWILGSLLFCFGIGLLLLTNWMRFGSPIEFGHKLNLQTIYGSLYATRFDHPLQQAPLSVGAKELFGALFFMKPSGNASFFAQGIFWGQAKLPRMRDMYFSVYDWTYIPWLVAGIVLLVRWLWAWQARSG